VCSAKRLSLGRSKKQGFALHIKMNLNSEFYNTLPARWRTFAKCANTKLNSAEFLNEEIQPS